jgi:hypothetical protein
MTQFLKKPQSSLEDDKNAQTAPVNWGKANPWNLFNMHGNVMEWCGEAGVPGKGHAVRGGSWASPLMQCHSGSRESWFADATSVVVGFRVVVTSIPEGVFPAAPLKDVPATPPPAPQAYFGTGELAPLPGSAKARINPSAPEPPLKVGDQTYTFGLGVASPAKLAFPVKRASYKRFVAVAGLDPGQAASQAKAAVRCRVYLDGILMATSPVLRYVNTGVSQWPFDLAIPEGVNQIQLEAEDVEPEGAGTVNWVNAGFRSDAPQVPPAPSATSQTRSHK